MRARLSKLQALYRLLDKFGFHRIIKIEKTPRLNNPIMVIFGHKYFLCSRSSTCENDCFINFCNADHIKFLHQYFPSIPQNPPSVKEKFSMFTHDHKITISVGASRRAATWQPQTLLISEFYERLRMPARGTYISFSYQGPAGRPEGRRQLCRRRPQRTTPQGRLRGRQGCYYTGP